ncbi:hypothetical protein IFM89_012998 [Coptis chinensis]|uniref:DUF4283 domain-containing protein n=1 Tax=Coptis chinensis TaxID=261450 RepID=A0A835IVR4_9MAGN|nr:hypothetical protein IFM89_012998 [Coptis chinensis]
MAEEDGFIYENTEDWENSILGKLFSPKRFTDDDIKAQLAKQWETKSMFIIFFITKGIFKVRFSDKEEMDFVLENGPWMIHGYVMSFKAWEPNRALERYDSHCFKMWIQIYRIPAERRHWEEIQAIGSGFGSVVALDAVGGADSGSSFTRVQVEFPKKRGWWRRLLRNWMKELCRVKASSYKFGKGIQEQKVMVWDPQKEKREDQDLRQTLVDMRKATGKNMVKESLEITEIEEHVLARKEMDKEKNNLSEANKEGPHSIPVLEGCGGPMEEGLGDYNPK